jgi:tetratricopeptide (TPR) repeat protein
MERKAALKVEAPRVAPPVMPSQTATGPAETAASNPAAVAAGNFPGQAADYLLHPEAPYLQRLEFLGRLRNEGLLPGVVAELEKRGREETNNPAIPATLGQAYLLQASLATNSISEQGLLGLKADQAFDRALAQDAGNWEARYWKAVAMSHWPAALNKSQEVMQHFVKLVEQQEAEPPQPQFAETYAWLGKQYLKAGYPEYARQAWERGLVLFPNNEQLAANMNGLPK